MSTNTVATPPPTTTNTKIVQNGINNEISNSSSTLATTETAAASSTTSPELLTVKNTNESNCNNLKENNNGISSSTTLSSSASPSSPSSSSSSSSCFNSSLTDIIKFLELVGSLKHTKRTGWVLRDVKDCESISGHMYRMSMMTFLLNGSEDLNQIRCMELALVHDLAECIVGDLTPFCGVSKEDKKQREMDAMESICNLIQPRGERMWKLFQEYESGETPESKFVKDLDRLDMVLQAFEYEKRDNCIMKHQEFFDSTEGKFNHPFVKKLIDEIYEQRKQLATNNKEQENNIDNICEQNVCHITDLTATKSSTTTATILTECSEDLTQKKLTTTS